MYKVLIWGTGRRYCQMIHIIKYYEMMGKISIVGITSNDSFYTIVDGYPFIPKKKLAEIEFDFIIVAIEDYHNAVREAEFLYGNQIKEKMIAGRVLQHPNFDFERYSKIRKNIPSIISLNCFAGFLYHNLGLPFLSPTINMFWLEDDYYKLLRDLRKYMGASLELKRMGWDAQRKQEYPICMLGDICVYMQHYKTYEEAKDKWESRVGRINYDNLLIVSKTSDRNMAEKFLELPYINKMCFTSFKMKNCIDVSDICNLSYSDSKLNMNERIGAIMNDSAWGRYGLYNPFRILDNGDEKRV